MRVHFLTHPEVAIDPEQPVVEWGLSERGRQRAREVAEALPGAQALMSSPEVKAEQAAQIIGAALDLPVTLVGGLAEVNRAATGYLPEPEFWANYQQFLERPSHSARGWETAEAAQQRIVRTVDDLIRRLGYRGSQHDRNAADSPPKALVLMSHGGVGALLLSHLTGTPIQRLSDQPGQGSCFSFDGDSGEVLTGWVSFEEFRASSAMS